MLRRRGFDGPLWPLPKSTGCTKLARRAHGHLRHSSGGVFFAATDQFPKIAVEGRGGHAAKPHSLRLITTVVAAHIVLALQSIVSRNADPHAGKWSCRSRPFCHPKSQAFNVIPQHVIFARGTVRTLSKGTCARLAEDRLPKLAEMTAQAYGRDRAG